ncbi:NAD(P)-binding protein [Penicillium hispanicum]|uniref:NAD(P)-binding protein n=1 Tax=Penicillium hispanicum TaxID=1080232 RepID=UPI00254034AC|nr:NAD(P)-binding protein [Penicillium hispanicum]KAJ5580224.1 NAD(P)-binding protein [Penicillium hispanicum]
MPSPPPNMATKRRQFSSCEACRKSRVGCDARRTSPQPCSNCARRQRPCVVTWAKASASTDSSPTDSSPSSGEASLSPATCAANRRQEGSVLHANLLKMFSTIFETRLGSFLGVHCCPIISGSSSNNSLLALMAALDDVEPISEAKDHFDDRKDATNTALIAAVRAFSLKFLAAQVTHADPSATCEDIQNRPAFRLAWTQAVQAARHATKRPSYRSILTLYVVAVTALSIHDSSKARCFEDSCLASASSQVRQLQHARRSPLRNDLTCQNVAYWCGIVIENGCRFTRPHSPGRGLLFSSNNQFWMNVRDQTSAFHQSFQCLHGMAEPMSKDVRFIVLQHATMHKCMAWWDMGNVQCAATEAELVERTELAVRDVLAFQEVFVPLLDLVARDFLLIHPRDQLNYILLVVHFNWAVLLFGKEMDRQVVGDLIKCYPSDLAAVRSIVNALSLAQSVGRGGLSQPTALLLDPVPEVMCGAISSTAASIMRLYDQGVLTLGASRTMLSVCLSSLETLRKVSLRAKSVAKDVRAQALQRSILMESIGPLTISSSTPQRLQTALAALTTEFPSAAPTLAGHVCDLSTAAVEDNLAAGPGASLTLTTGGVWERPSPAWTVVAGYMGRVCSIARNLALEMKPVRVNAVSRGLVDTELWDASFGREEKEGMFAALAEKHPTGRIARAEDVAEAYMYLKRDENVTGRVVRSDSGAGLV